MKKVFNIFTQYKGLRKEMYILFIGRVVTSFGAMIWPVLTMILNQKLGMEPRWISVYFVASGAIMLPANLLGGKLADKFNKKKVIICFDIVSVIMELICAFIPLSYVTIGILTVSSIFQSIEYPSYDALVADLSTTEDREKAYSLEYLGGNLGMVLSPTIAGILFKDYLWVAFLTGGISIGISTILIALFVRNISPEKETSVQSQYQASRDTESLFRILGENKILVLYMLASALFGIAYSEYSFLMPLDMGRIHGDDGALIYGTVFSLNCIVVVIFTPVITKLFEKMTDLKRILVGQILQVTGYGLFILLIGIVPIYYVVMLVFTWGEIFTTISAGPYMSKRTPSSHRGRINGFNSVFSAIFMGAADLAVGFLYDKAGSYTAWFFVIGLYIVSIMMTFVLISLDRKRYPALYLENGEETAEQTEE